MSKWITDKGNECPKCGSNIELLVDENKEYGINKEVKFVRVERCTECDWERGLDHMEEQVKSRDRELHENEKIIDFLNLIIEQKETKIEEKEKEIDKLEEKWSKTVSGSLRDFAVKSEQVGKLMDHLNYLRKKDFLTDDQEKKFLKTLFYLFEDVNAYVNAISEEIDIENYPFDPLN